MNNVRKDIVSQATVIVVKVGSGVISEPDGGGLNTSAISSITRQVAALAASGKKVLIVSSGAVSAGLSALSMERMPDNIPYRQAAAAVGQSHLIGSYENYLRKKGLRVAQVLLTHADLASRERYLNIKNTLSTILAHNIIPVINENDTVSVKEIKFGDNDTLSAMVAALVGAHLLVLLSDVDGLCESDPVLFPGAALVKTVSKITPAIIKLVGGATSSTGVGGMVTKIKAAGIASSSGIPTIIINGRKKDSLSKLMRGEDVGTLFLQNKNKLKSKKHWIAHTLKPAGTVIIDAGASRALVSNGKSLLPSGILAVQGDFKMGDSICCLFSNKEIARGLTNYASGDLKKLIGKHTREIEKVLGVKYYDEVIHRDNLVLV